jgi:superfamily II DNA or RNA helicase
LDGTYTTKQAQAFFASLNIPPEFEERDFQIETLKHAVNNKRALFLSPTGSGKSMSIYLLTQYFKAKTLLVVPTANLLLQMQTDLKSYGYDRPIGQYGDSIKDDTRDITVATWQSIYKLDPEWFAQFGMVIIDEAHLASAASLKGIMEKMPECDLRFGFTGTLNGTKTHRMILEGLFGPVKRVATTKELIDRGILSPFNIKAIKLIHPKHAKKFISTKQDRGEKDKDGNPKKTYADYPQEMEFLINSRKRNNFLANLALSQKGNTLLLFHRVEEHGKALYELIQKKAPKRKVFYIHGKIKAKEREAIRAEIETSENCILVASYGTLSTGVNIKRLDNLIFGSPWKSQIINLQSIGRVLRPLKGKMATLFDVSDDLSWKSHLNHTLKHLVERLKIYNAEEFDYKLFDVELNYEEGGP